MKTALLQMSITDDKQKNVERAISFLEQAKQKCADIAILPEMFCCPYATKNFPLYAEKQDDMVWQSLSNAAKQYHMYIVGGSMPEKEESGAIYNTCYVFDREGKQIAKHRKMHLFDINVSGGQYFKESDTLTAGNDITVFDTEFGKIGVCICYDIRFVELSRIMALEGANMIIVPAAFNMTTGPAHRELSFRARALDNQVYTIGVAPARNQYAEYVSYGNSIVVSPWGEVITRLSEKEEIAFCDIDLNIVNKIRQELPILTHRREDIYTLKRKE